MKFPRGQEVALPGIGRPWPLLVVLCVSAIIGCAMHLPASAPAEPAFSGGLAADGPIARFVDLLADERARRGCPPLAWDARVAGVAGAHSRDMVERGYFSHVSPEGHDPFDRLAAAGIGYSAAAENIAFGRRTGDGVYAQWLGSPGHRDNMLECSYTHHGVGLHASYWTHILIRPRS